MRLLKLPYCASDYRANCSFIQYNIQYKNGFVSQKRVRSYIVLALIKHGHLVHNSEAEFLVPNQKVVSSSPIPLSFNVSQSNAWYPPLPPVPPLASSFQSGGSENGSSRMLETHQSTAAVMENSKMYSPTASRTLVGLLPQFPSRQSTGGLEFSTS